MDQLLPMLPSPARPRAALTWHIPPGEVQWKGEARRSGNRRVVLTEDGQCTITFTKSSITTTDKRKGTEIRWRFPELAPLESTHTLLIEMTERCNLHCNYCFLNAPNEGPVPHSPFPLIPHIGAAVERLHHKNIKIVFFGGEPSLNLKGIEEVAQTFPSDRVSFGMQTNGTLLSPKTLDTLTDAKIGISVSFDGLPELHDANRVFPKGAPSSQIVTERIRTLHQRGTNFGVICTVSSRSLSRVGDIMSNLLEIGVRRVSFVPLHTTDARINGRDYAKFLLEALRWADGNRTTSPAIRELRAWASNIFLQRPMLCGAGSPCGAGESISFLTLSGKIWDCPEKMGATIPIAEFPVRPTDMPTEPPGNGQGPAQALPAVCRDCAFLEVCRGGCPVRFGGYPCEFVYAFVPEFVRTVMGTEGLLEYLLAGPPVHRAATQVPIVG